MRSLVVSNHSRVDGVHEADSILRPVNDFIAYAIEGLPRDSFEKHARDEIRFIPEMISAIKPDKSIPNQDGAGTGRLVDLIRPTPLPVIIERLKTFLNIPHSKILLVITFS